MLLKNPLYSKNPQGPRLFFVSMAVSVICFVLFQRLQGSKNGIAVRGQWIVGDCSMCQGN